MEIKLFSEIKSGEHFKELRIKNPRKFIKLQLILPSGLSVVYDSFENIKNVDDYRYVETGRRTNSLHYNAIDYEGIPASCPGFVKFIVFKPLKKKVNNERPSNSRLASQQ